MQDEAISHVQDDEREDIKKFVSILQELPRDDRVMLLSNANALRVRRDIEKAKEASEHNAGKDNAVT